MAIEVNQKEFNEIKRATSQETNENKNLSRTSNKLSDVNEYLFAQLDRISNDDLEGDDLEKELKRSKAVAQITGNIIKSASVSLNAAKFMDEVGYSVDKKEIKLLGGGDD